MYFASIIDTDFSRIKEIAVSYRNIELCLARLNPLTTDKLIEIIDVSNNVILTDITELDIDYVKQIMILPHKKIIIDCPLQEHINKKLTSFISDVTYKKILSVHYFYNIPLIKDIPQIIENQLIIANINIECFNFIKIAVTCNSINDVEELFRLFNWKSNLILVPMGKEWTKYRKKSLELGSLFMYGYVDKPTAEGQEKISI